MTESLPKVYLVGAGPGDPLLLTLKAKQLLQEAEVVLYDYLVHQNIIVLVNKNSVINNV